MTHQRILHLKDALTRVTASVNRLESKKIPLERAFNRVASQDIRAGEDHPRFDRARMDGYTFWSGDTVNATSGNPARFRVVGVIEAGKSLAAGLQSGQAAHILTGGTIPSGADTMAKEEETRRQGKDVLVPSPVSAHRHIVHKGTEIKRGTYVVRAGQVLTPAVLGTLASLGQQQVDVVRRPRVSLLAIGDELTSVHDVCCAHEVVASNLYMLSALVNESGGVVNTLAVSKDDTAAIQDKLVEALQADLVITTGGSGKSPLDLTRAALTKGGVDFPITGLSMTPGKSACFGFYGDKPVFVLPGTPSAVFTIFYALVRPVLLHLMGKGAHEIETVSAVLDGDLTRKAGSEHWVQGQISTGADGLHVLPLTSPEVGPTAAIMRTNGFILVEADHTRLKRGETVAVQPLPGMEHDAFPSLAGQREATRTQSPETVCIVGRADAGKTTFLEKLLAVLRTRGYRVGTIKHNTHGFEIDHQGKDSWRLKRAGAATVVISSPQKVALIRDVTAEESVDTLVERYLSDMDLVLTEGYKNASRPKIEIFRDRGHDIPLCIHDPTLLTIVSDIPMNMDLPRFGLEDIDGVADLLEKTFLTRTHS